jgi:nitrilase
MSCARVGNGDAGQGFAAEFGVPAQLADRADDFLLRGGSGIIGPDGRYVAEPVFDEERTIAASLDLAAVDREKMTLDVSGHYNRPDIFDFALRKKDR